MKTVKSMLMVGAMLLAAGAATGALADDRWVGDVGSNWMEHVQSAPQTKTRAEVIKELKEAREQGKIVIGEDPSYPQLNLQSSKTRAEVVAELKQASKEGLLFQGEAPFYPSAPVAKRTDGQDELTKQAVAGTGEKTVKQQ